MKDIRSDWFEKRELCLFIHSDYEAWKQTVINIWRLPLKETTSSEREERFLRKNPRRSRAGKESNRSQWNKSKGSQCLPGICQAIARVDERSHDDLSSLGFNIFISLPRRQANCSWQTSWWELQFERLKSSFPQKKELKQPFACERLVMLPSNLTFSFSSFKLR